MNSCDAAPAFARDQSQHRSELRTRPNGSTSRRWTLEVPLLLLVEPVLVARLAAIAAFASARERAMATARAVRPLAAASDASEYTGDVARSAPVAAATQACDSEWKLEVHAGVDATIDADLAGAFTAAADVAGRDAVVEPQRHRAMRPAGLHADETAREAIVDRVVSVTCRACRHRLGKPQTENGLWC